MKKKANVGMYFFFFVLLTNLSSDISVQSRKDNVALGELALGLAGLDDHVPDVGRDGLGHLPLGGLGVGLSGRARRGTKSMDRKARVLGEEEDEALADSAGGTKNSSL